MRRTVLAVMAGILLAGGGWVAGQQTQLQPIPVEPTILSGPDFGFRVEGKDRGGVVGTPMVRLKSGEWVEAYASPWRGRVVPLDTK